MLGRGPVLTTGGLGAGNDRDEAVLQGLTRAGRARRGDACGAWAARRAPAETAIDPRDLRRPRSPASCSPRRAARICGSGSGTRPRDVGAAGARLPARRPRCTTTPIPEFGAGCHPRPGLRRCCARCSRRSRRRLTFIAGSRDDMGGELYEPGAEGAALPRGRSVAGRAGARRPCAAEGCRGSANAAAELDLVPRGAERARRAHGRGRRSDRARRSACRCSGSARPGSRDRATRRTMCPAIARAAWLRR